MTNRSRLRNWALPLAIIYAIVVWHAYAWDSAFRDSVQANAVWFGGVFVGLLAVALVARYWQRESRVVVNLWMRLAILYVAALTAGVVLSSAVRHLVVGRLWLFLIILGGLLAVVVIEKLRRREFPPLKNWGLQWSVVLAIVVCSLYLADKPFREFLQRHWLYFLLILLALPVLSLVLRMEGLETPGRLRSWAIQLAVVYAVAVIAIYLVNASFREYAQDHWLWAIDVWIGLVVVAVLARPRGLELYREYPEPDEQQTINEIIQLFIGRLQKAYDGGEITLRDTHPKSNGLLFCEFEVLPDLPPQLAVGLFSEPKRYKCWARFSNSEPDVTPDADKDFRGIALKLFDVPGEKLQDDERGTFDFLFIAHDGFFAANPKDFLSFFAHVFQFGPAGRFLYFLPTRLRLLRNAILGRRSYGHPFEITWFSCAPYRLGKRVVKYKLQSEWPASEPDRGNPHYLRERLTATLAERGHTMEFKIQFQEDPNRDLIETTAIPWRVPQFRTVARLHFPPQEFNSLDHHEFDESLTFNPWHCLPEHRPVGGINRARRDVMRAIQEFRLARNGRQRTNVLTEIPDDAPAAARPGSQSSVGGKRC